MSARGIVISAVEDGSLTWEQIGETLVRSLLSDHEVGELILEGVDFEDAFDEESED